MSETVETGTGAILYDPTVVNQISDASFLPATWPRSAKIYGRLRSAGRGGTFILGDDRRQFVLRHYHRGGAIATISRDSYLWLGAERTRSFAEYRLLRRLTETGLPVPRPVAARYRRSGLTYTADLMTEFVAGIRPLSDRLRDAVPAGFWSGIGAGIARFHAAGVNHADLNAYNVQVDEDDEVFLLDLDRGRLMRRGSWQERNLARLHRSLQKIRRLDDGVQFSAKDWREFRRSYADSAGSA